MPNLAIDFRLYLITDRKLCNGQTLLDKVETALAHGVKAIQLREKDLPARELLELTKKLKRATHKQKAKLFINDRLDVALAADADGIHSPEEGLPIEMARKFLPEKLIGKSVHSLEKALEAERSGAHFITFSPIFATASKEGILEPKGLKALEQVASSVKIPVFALGGITPPLARKCASHGAHGVAVISSVLKSTDIAKTVLQFQSVLGGL